MPFFENSISIRVTPGTLILIDRVVKSDLLAESRADYVRRLVLQDLRAKFPLDFKLKGGLI